MINIIETQIKKLNQVYQPIFGYEDKSFGEVRSSKDRLLLIVEVYKKLLESTGKKTLKVLDLGCAQGYFSLNLALLGAEVTAVELDVENFNLCQLLKKENKFVNIEFNNTSIEDFIFNNEKLKEYDIILCLNILHHVCYINGKEVALTLFKKLSEISSVVLYEAALSTEPVFWANTLPEKTEYFTDIFQFSLPLKFYNTHLSNVGRPFYFCSNTFWFIPDYKIGKFEYCLLKSSSNREDFFQGTRRYYIGKRDVLKIFSLKGSFSELNYNELTSEANFLNNNFNILSYLPKVFKNDKINDFLILHREYLEGMKINEIKISEDIILDLLKQLSILEKEGYYHNDLKKWNILVDEEKVRLLDYGSISKVAYNTGKPSNIYISFLLLLRELLTNTNERYDDLYNPYISANHFSGMYKSFISKIWEIPYELWSFDRFLGIFMQLDKNDVFVVDNDIWNSEIESCIGTLNSKYIFLEEKIIKIEKEYNKTESLLEQTGVKLIETESLLEQTGVKLIETESLLEQTGVKLIETESLLEQTEVKFVETTQRLLDIEKSFFWKITKPFRIILSISKKILGK